MFTVLCSLIRILLSAHRGGLPSNPLVLELGLLPSATDTAVNLTPERLSSRHCALLGATGEGKSWTISRLVEQVSAQNAKLLLFDAIGEFYPLEAGVSHVQMGVGKPQPDSCNEGIFPYYELTEADLFALFEPTGLTQGPSLRLAMKSLKLAKLDPSLANDGCIRKIQKE